MISFILKNVFFKFSVKVSYNRQAKWVCTRTQRLSDLACKHFFLPFLGSCGGSVLHTHSGQMGSWTSVLQGYDIINFYCLSHPVYDILLMSVSWLRQGISFALILGGYWRICPAFTVLFILTADWGPKGCLLSKSHGNFQV